MNAVRMFIARGAFAGAASGIVVALFQWTVTERWIDKALAVEEAAESAAGHHDADELFSRPAQVVGGMLGAILFGVFLGVIFAVVLAKLWHRLPGVNDFARALRLAGVAFVTVTLVPALKYPPNPPAVGDTETVDERTAAYLALVLTSIVLSFVVWRVWDATTERGIGGARRFGLAALLYTGVLTPVFVLFPSNPDAIEVSANLIWHFRVLSIGQAAIMWTGIALGFGLLCEWSEIRDGAGSGNVADRVTSTNV